jgi:hypothetical protein
LHDAERRLLSTSPHLQFDPHGFEISHDRLAHREVGRKLMFVPPSVVLSTLVTSVAGILASPAAVSKPLHDVS